MTKKVKKCVRCGHEKVIRPRGLCWACYYRSGEREKYAPTGICGTRGIGNDVRKPKMPKPTTVPPGKAKVEILAARAAAGQQLFHPLDAGYS